ncbi:phage tail protein [Motiliproteus sp. MSK22-1]|uniref:phage tail protein n=1 Tax=Motiliproteus sp. MSK22-1 TaxID=1897630 RepID=UPI00097554A8|nr:tail fiber protein [Motiliproteus sp. MSK22-1]OMH33805.1 phage tail protein [Motiliproteus sp. MSK22-1]
MSDPFIGEIRMFAGNFAPRTWAFCDNSLITPGSNEALFSLLGTRYGGNGRTTFALPDMRGRLPMHQGTGPGLTPRPIGQRTGVETVTLTAADMPSHTHPLEGSGNDGDSAEPQSRTLGSGQQAFDTGNTNLVAMSPSQVSDAGGSQPHYNMMPFLCVSFIIALQGDYPSRT